MLLIDAVMDIGIGISEPAEEQLMHRRLEHRPGAGFGDDTPFRDRVRVRNDVDRAAVVDRRHRGRVAAVKGLSERVLLDGLVRIKA